MSKRFVPVRDPERPRDEQDEEALRVHRSFDTPHAVLPKDLNNPLEHKDRDALARPSGNLKLDEAGLWRRKQELFKRETKFGEGKATTQFSNPEVANIDGADRPVHGNATCGWANFGGKVFGDSSHDDGTGVVQRGEVKQKLVLNEKGLWVRRNSAGQGSDELNAMSRAAHLRQAPSGEDPRCEAAGKKRSQDPGSAEKALAKMKERRAQEMRDRMQEGEQRARATERIMAREVARGTLQRGSAQRTAGGESGRLKRLQQSEARKREERGAATSLPAKTTRSRSPRRREDQSFAAHRASRSRSHTERHNRCRSRSAPRCEVAASQRPGACENRTDGTCGGTETDCVEVDFF